MTLIVGLNLSDRLYLGADTRVTFKNGSFKDNIIKTCVLSGFPSTISGSFETNTICMCVAGDLKLVTYLYQCIKSSLDGGILSNDIRELSEQIKDFIGEMYNERLRKGNAYSNCCIIFGGMLNTQKKRFDMETLAKLKQKVKDNLATEEELMIAKNKLYSNSHTPELLKKISNRYTDPGKTTINPLISKAIEQGNQYLEAPDSLIFSVSVTNRGVKIETAERGEFLAYGTNQITKGNFSEDFLAKMELNIGQGNTQIDLVETGNIRNTIPYVAKTLNIKQIGGVITPIVLRDNKYAEIFTHHRRELLTGKNVENIFLKDGKYFSQLGEEEINELIPFYMYTTNQVDAAL